MGHLRSPNSVSVTFAFLDPSVLPDSGIPFSSVSTAAAVCCAAGLSGLGGEPLAPVETAIATATKAAATTPTPASIRKRRLRWARSSSARSSARLRLRACSFCSLREAIVRTALTGNDGLQQRFLRAMQEVVGNQPRGEGRASREGEGARPERTGGSWLSGI